MTEMLYALTSAYSHTDHDNRRLGRPVETNIGKLFSIYAWGLGLVHEQADLIMLWDNLDNAKGRVLDRYGANFGVQRYGASDAFYRLAIKVKVLAQLSGGDINTVLNAAAELLGVDMPEVLLDEVFPAKIALFVDQDLLDEERLEMIEPIAWAIKRILAAGVGMRLYMRTYRTYRYDLPIAHGGAIGTFYEYPPIGEARELVWNAGVVHAGVMRTSFEPPPVVGKDKTFYGPVSVAHSGFLPPALIGIPPAAQMTAVDHRSGRGGTYMRSHIKPKRID